jgi:Big-like domain-containing protein/VCBS repeat protein/FG-GAP repeat protein
MLRQLKMKMRVGILTALIALAANAQQELAAQSSSNSSAGFAIVHPDGHEQKVRPSSPKVESPEPTNFSPARTVVPPDIGMSEILFLPAVTYFAGGGAPLSVVAADVNGDGKPDLVVTNQCSINDNLCTKATAGVLLGNGDGTFQPVQTYSSGSQNAVSVAVADVNADGKPDLLVANLCSACSSGEVSVLLGNGDGTFQSAVTYSSGAFGAWSIVVADVNKDGKPDLLVSSGCENPIICPTGGVGVLLGNGDGTFKNAVVYLSGGIDAKSLAVADVNKDGNLDLLVANENSNGLNGTVGVLFGNGDGTFQTAKTYDCGAQETDWIAAADVNLDGNIDLIVSNADGSTGAAVGVLLGNGDGTFQSVKNYSSGSSLATSIAVADVNLDGKPDLLVANWGLAQAGKITVLLGRGDGTFQIPQIYSSGGMEPGAIAAADVNGDGRIDVLVAEGLAETGKSGVGVLLNQSKFATTSVLSSSLNPSTYGQKVTWTAMVTSSGSITPTGKVRFTWSGNTIGSAILNSSGVATFSRSNLNADPYPLTAVYVGDAANLGSTSPVLNQVVLETTSTATLTSSPNPSKQGQTVTFTAKISSPTVIPTGPVTFTAGKTVLGTAQLSGGKATLTTSSLADGSTKVTATYYGDSNIAKSSASVIQTMQ